MSTETGQWRDWGRAGAEKDWMGIRFPVHRMERTEVKDKLRKTDWTDVITTGLEKTEHCQIRQETVQVLGRER